MIIHHPTHLHHNSHWETSSMEDQNSYFGWECLELHAEEGIEELKQALLYTALELEKTIESAKEEITSRELELFHLRSLFNIVMKERDEALCKCRLLLLEKPSKTSDPAEHGASKEDPLSSSSSSSSTTSSSSSSHSSLTEEALETVVAVEKMEKKNPLPEKGRLLQAVMGAGPLLQTLLLAGGPLPEWHHPPPKIDSSNIPIPPLAFSPSGSKSVSGLCEALENSPSPKFRKVVSGS